MMEKAPVLVTPKLSCVPPGTKPIHAGKHSWVINFCANTCGVCIRTRANTGKYFEELFLPICQILGGIHCGANIRTRANTGKILGELFMYWFRAR